ncbi:hypothetical protein [Saccharothrix syringae]|uniref:Uncharacterized protein n=1 Tax=Saccharothrix syringae TaxID=103733 RepID=A0A5Q0GXG0_SACSY|nr:hypothetical protein [Saccharothrix syringae]QFZ18669.1 hypothetical protein EKG83_15415 [Saccharothrix syringae]
MVGKEQQPPREDEPPTPSTAKRLRLKKPSKALLAGFADRRLAEEAEALLMDVETIDQMIVNDYERQYRENAVLPGWRDVFARGSTSGRVERATIVSEQIQNSIVLRDEKIAAVERLMKEDKNFQKIEEDLLKRQGEWAKDPYAAIFERHAREAKLLLEMADEAENIRHRVRVDDTGDPVVRSARESAHETTRQMLRNAAALGRGDFPQRVREYSDDQPNWRAGQLYHVRTTTALVGMADLIVQYGALPAGLRLGRPAADPVHRRLDRRGLSEDQLEGVSAAVAKLNAKYAEDLDDALRDLSPTGKTVYVVSTAEGALGNADLELTEPERAVSTPIVVTMQAWMTSLTDFITSMHRLDERMRAENLRMNFALVALSNQLGKNVGGAAVTASVGALLKGPTAALCALGGPLVALLRDVVNIATMDNPFLHLPSALAMPLLDDVVIAGKRLGDAVKSVNGIRGPLKEIAKKVDEIKDVAERIRESLKNIPVGKIAGVDLGDVVKGAFKPLKALNDQLTDILANLADPLSAAVEKIGAVVVKPAQRVGARAGAAAGRTALGGPDQLGSRLDAERKAAEAMWKRLRSHAIARGTYEAAKPAVGQRITTEHTTLAFSDEGAALAFATSLPESIGGNRHVTVMRVRLNNVAGYDIGPLASYLRHRDAGLDTVIRSGAQFDITSVSVVQGPGRRKVEWVTADETGRMGPSFRGGPVDSEPKKNTPVTRILARYLIEGISSAVAMTYLAPRLAWSDRGDISAWAKENFGNQGAELVDTAKQYTRHGSVEVPPSPALQANRVKKFVVSWVVEAITGNRRLAGLVKELLTERDIEEKVFEKIAQHQEELEDRPEGVRKLVGIVTDACREALDKVCSKGEVVRSRERESRHAMQFIGVAMAALKTALTESHSPEAVVDSIMATEGVVGAGLKGALAGALGDVEGYRFAKNTIGGPEAALGAMLISAVRAYRSLTELHQRLVHSPLVASLARWLPEAEAVVALASTVASRGAEPPAALRTGLSVAHYGLASLHSVPEMMGFRTVATMSKTEVVALELMLAAGVGVAGHGVRHVAPLLASGVRYLAGHPVDAVVAAAKLLLPLAKRHPLYRAYTMVRPPELPEGVATAADPDLRSRISTAAWYLVGRAEPRKPNPDDHRAYQLLDTALGQLDLVGAEVWASFGRDKDYLVSLVTTPGAERGTGGSQPTLLARDKALLAAIGLGVAWYAGYLTPLGITTLFSLGARMPTGFR